MGLAMLLRHIVPPRWIINTPKWTNTLIADQPIWRWVSILIVLFVFWTVLGWARSLTRYLQKGTSDHHSFWGILPLVVLVGITPIYSWFFSEILRVSGFVYTVFNFSVWSLFFVSLTLLVWKGGHILAEIIIILAELKSVSLDSQIIRLGFRLISLGLSLLIITEGANRLGLPAYSVLAGLGIGGLAVALAAQHSLANLLGSLIIMIEKPFRVGHRIKSSAVQGLVEDVGFRSTRIRTQENTLVNVPSSDLINHPIENLTTRKHRASRQSVYFSLETPIQKIRTMIGSISHILSQGNGVVFGHVDVVLRSISHKGFEVMFDFAVKVHTEMEEFRAQQNVLLEIAAVAEREGVKFSRFESHFTPSETMEMESTLPEEKAGESSHESPSREEHE